jgi:hypothetical protein
LDVELSDLVVDDVAFVDDVLFFKLQLKATGLAGRRIEVELRSAGTRQVLASRSVEPTSDAHRETVVLAYRPTDVGQFDFVVEVDPLPDESNRQNNTQRAAVHVRKDEIRVLLVQSDPSYEFRFLKHLLEREQTAKREKTIVVHVWLQEADPEYAQIDRSGRPGLPLRPDELARYDVIVVGDVNPALVSPTALENLRDFVRQNAGGMVFIAGPRYTPTAFRGTPLEELLPIELSAVRRSDPERVYGEPFRLAPTELGLASPAMQLGDTAAETAKIWQQLPPLYWWLEAPQLRPGAWPLAEHPTERTADGRRLPLVSMQYVDAGTVLFHAIDATYLWRGPAQDKHFARYWMQTIRALARSKMRGADRRILVSTDHDRYRRGEPVRVQVRFGAERDAPVADDGVEVALEREGAASSAVTLRRRVGARGLFAASVDGLADGAYRARLARPTASDRATSATFAVLPPSGELDRLEADVAELTAAASTSGGRYYEWQDAGRLADDLPAGRPMPTGRLPGISLWNSWPVPVALVLLLVSEWILRKRLGML